MGNGKDIKAETAENVSYSKRVIADRLYITKSIMLTIEFIISSEVPFKLFWQLNTLINLLLNCFGKYFTN